MMSLRSIGRVSKWLLWLTPLLFLALFFFYPLASILGVSLTTDEGIDLSGFSRLFTQSYFLDTFVFTVTQAFLSASITLLTALPVAYVFARYEFPGRRFILSLTTLPFVLPTVVVAAAFSALLGPRGVVNTLWMDIFATDQPLVQLERTFTLILIAHVFYNFSVALRMLSGYWMNINPRVEEAAQILGASGWRLWWYVRLPMLRPALTAAFVLVFVFCFTSFGVVIILGGPTFATLEVEIYRQVMSLFNLPVAAALSLLQIGFMFLLMVVYTRLQRQVNVDLQSSRNILRKPRTRNERVFIGIVIFLMMLFLFAPLFALVVRSLTTANGQWTLQYFQSLGQLERRSVLFVPPAESIINSLAFAGIATVMAVILGTLSAFFLARGGWLGRLLDPVFMLPLATSAVTLGFGFIIALDEPPLNLRSSIVLIPIAHALVGMPFVIRSVYPAVRAVRPDLRFAAQILGASPFQVIRRIDIPLVYRGIVVGATFAFTMSMGEFGASTFVARPDTPTMPLIIFRLLGQPGASNYGQAMAMSVLLMLVCALAFILIERLRFGGVGEF